MPKLPADRGRAKSLEDYGRYAGLGFQFAAAMGVLGWLGWWLDETLSTSPLFLIVGILAGATGGFISLIKSVPGVTGGTSRDAQNQARDAENEARDAEHDDPTSR